MPKYFNQVDSRKQKPIAIWSERDSIDGKIVDVKVIILRTTGCFWSKDNGCTMCGYGNDVSRENISEKDFKEQISCIINNLENNDYVKIFTSGSFFDDNEIPINIQKEILMSITEKLDKCRILVESRPEFITRKKLHSIKNINNNIEIAIGFETVSDVIRNSYIQKGFSTVDFINAANEIHSLGFKLKTYLLLKPPFISELDSIYDAIKSIEFISERYPGSIISINPVNVQKNTMIEHLYKRGLYRPSWLWSLSYILKVGCSRVKERVRIVSYPTAAGKSRGIHNCGKCDEYAINGIREFSIHGNDEYLLEPLKCCSEIWKSYLLKDSFS